MSLLVNSSFHSIPLFDLSKDLPLDEFRGVCHQVGFFYLKNFGIRPEFMKRVLDLTKVFFDQAQEEKDSLKISLSPHYRGYGNLGAEKTLGLSDYKETFDLGLEQEAVVGRHYNSDCDSRVI